MEDNLNLKDNGRQPQYLGKWKIVLEKREMTSIFLENEIQPLFFLNGRQPQFYIKMEDNFCCWKNGREPQFVKKI